MKSAIKKTILRGLLFARNFLNLFLSFQETSILVYHSISGEPEEISVSPKNFLDQIIYLKKTGFVFVKLPEVFSWATLNGSLPRKSVALTFDDGYRDFLSEALPILEKYEIPVTIFLSSDMAKAENNFGNSIPLLSPSEIQALKENKLVSFGSHGLSHLLLDRLDHGGLKTEIGVGSGFFAYPGGHHNKIVRGAVKTAGYQAAFSISPGLVKQGSDPFFFKRNVITKNMKPWEVFARATKAIDWYVSLK